MRFFYERFRKSSDSNAQTIKFIIKINTQRFLKLHNLQFRTSNKINGSK